jgi:hypothetical protein
MKNFMIFLSYVACLIFGSSSMNASASNSEFPQDMLIIIEMQKKFSASECIEAQECILQEIENAKKRNHIILFVNMNVKSDESDLGRNVEIFQETLQNYHNVHIVTKFFSSGSRVILDFIKQRHLNLSEISVCGINTGACVKSTVQNLLDKGEFQILTLVASACASECFIKDCDCDKPYCERTHRQHLQQIQEQFVRYTRFRLMPEMRTEG